MKRYSRVMRRTVQAADASALAAHLATVFELGRNVEAAPGALPPDEEGDAAPGFLRRLRRMARSGVPDTIVVEWRHPDGRIDRHEMHVVPEADRGQQALAALEAGRNLAQRTEIALSLLQQDRYDPQSGLPNRRLLERLLQAEVDFARREGQRLAVLFIDLDRFKDVNDTFGHEAGDQLLVEAAQRIRAGLGAADTLARVAGDEFVVLLPQAGRPDTLRGVAQSLLAGLAHPFYLGQHKLRLSASVGIAVFPHDADTAVGLIGCADLAMYAVKLAGRNNLAFFTREMRNKNEQRHRLLRDLPDALAAGQFELHYQPILELRGGRINKAEALLRWRHPELGMVAPDRFIPLAEETGLIQQLGAWVLREAAATARRWNSMCPGSSKQIGVNLSPLQFAKGRCDLVALQVLRESGCEPAHLLIEVTEGLLLDDSPHVMSQLRNLSAAGVQIALDDFGTGYSAMSYLMKFNMDYLKIDRSFIRDMVGSPRSLAIVEAMVGMAHRLGMRVVAEGVETAAQADSLAAAGCEYGQGYLYCPPRPVDEFLELAAGAAA
jgi:diguanylate cyclase (GGDEF)-like protein